MKTLEIDAAFPFLEPPQSRCIAWYPAGAFYVNLAGNYNYLEWPYYDSQDLKFAGLRVHPTCKEMLDAYITPIFLEKARQAGIAVPDFYVTNGYFEPPVIIDPINPFLIKGRIVLKHGREQSIAKSMTRNFTYAICCQDLPPDSRIVYFRAIMGACHVPKYRALSQAIWEVFHIPLAKVRVIAAANERLLLSDISPLPLEVLGQRERHLLEKRIQWEK